MKSGDTVRVKSGPLCNCVGRVSEILDVSQSIDITVEFEVPVNDCHPGCFRWAFDSTELEPA
jgi:ribosomal protein L24